MCVCVCVFARGMGWGEVKSESKNKQKSAFEERKKIMRMRQDLIVSRKGKVDIK